MPEGPIHEGRLKRVQLEMQQETSKISNEIRWPVLV